MSLPGDIPLDPTRNRRHYNERAQGQAPLYWKKPGLRHVARKICLEIKQCILGGGWGGGCVWIPWEPTWSSTKYSRVELTTFARQNRIISKQ